MAEEDPDNGAALPDGPLPSLGLGSGEDNPQSAFSSVYNRFQAADGKLTVFVWSEEDNIRLDELLTSLENIQDIVDFCDNLQSHLEHGTPSIQELTLDILPDTIFDSVIRIRSSIYSRITVDDLRRINPYTFNINLNFSPKISIKTKSIINATISLWFIFHPVTAATEKSLPMCEQQAYIAYRDQVASDLGQMFRDLKVGHLSEEHRAELALKILDEVGKAACPLTSQPIVQIAPNDERTTNQTYAGLKPPEHKTPTFGDPSHAGNDDPDPPGTIRTGHRLRVPNPPKRPGTIRRRK